MKTVLIGLLLVSPFLSLAQAKAYGVRFKDMNGQEVNMQTFRGRKIIAVIVDAANPDWQQLKALDTVYRSNKPGLQVIAIPVTDFGGTAATNEQLKKKRQELNIEYPMTRIAKARKNANANQHALLKWLTHRDENKYIDNDIDEAGQMYVIGEQGTLYALVKKKMWPTGNWMKKVLSVQGK
jgi:glutathione peroxidase